MPNYAYTDYHITGSKSDISKLNDALISLDAHPNAEDRSCKYYGSRWWGYFLEAILGEIPDGIDTRGEICCFNKESSTCITMTVESAYHAPYDINRLLKLKFPSIRILYWGWPDDDGVMETNDKDGEIFPWRIGIEKSGEDEEFFKDEEQICNWLRENFGLDFSSLDEVREFVDNNRDQWTLHDDCCINDE